VKAYTIIVDTDALLDIKEAVDWYNMCEKNLGSRFKKNVKQQINSLKSNANLYNIRYKNIRCTLVKKFPFLIHFVIYEMNKSVKILAVIHTSRSPEIWDQKTNDFLN
jgi:hypothetical protein